MAWALTPGGSKAGGQAGSRGSGGAPGDSAGAERMVAAVQTGQGGEQLGLDQ